MSRAFQLKTTVTSLPVNSVPLCINNQINKQNTQCWLNKSQRSKQSDETTGAKAEARVCLAASIEVIRPEKKKTLKFVKLVVSDGDQFKIDSIHESL